MGGSERHLTLNVAAAIVDNIVPLEFTNEARDLDLRQFSLLYSDTQMLAIELTGDDLRAGLASMAIADGSTLQPSLTVLGFDTVVHSSVSDLVEAVEGREMGEADLMRLLARAPHFVLPLRKREGDRAYMQRISVGRARNKDVVLRHEGISKFHAWFEVDEEGRFYVADAGSRNGTRIDGVTLEPRKLERLMQGQKLEFGAVSCALYTPETFWRVIDR